MIESKDSSRVTEIKGINNYYGSLNVKNKEGKYFMKVFCELYPRDWIEIDEKLYVMLVKLNEN